MRYLRLAAIAALSALFHLPFVIDDCPAAVPLNNTNLTGATNITGTLNLPSTFGIGSFNANLGGNLTTAGAFTLSGSFSTALAVTASTSLTLPTSGTLATLAGTETLANKTLTTPTIQLPMTWSFAGQTDTTFTKGLSGFGGASSELDRLTIVTPGNTVVISGPDVPSLNLTTSDDNHEHMAYFWDRLNDAESPGGGIEVSDVDGVGKIITVNTATTASSATATVSSASGLFIAMNVTGAGISSGTWLKGIATPGTGPSVITLSAPATATASAASLSFSGGTAGNLFLQHTTDYGNVALPTTLTATNPVVTVSSAAGLAVGDWVAGSGIPANTTISAISGTSVTLSNAPTLSGSPVILYSVVDYRVRHPILIDRLGGAIHINDRLDVDAITLSADGKTLSFGLGGNLRSVACSANLQMGDGNVLQLDTIGALGASNPKLQFGTSGTGAALGTTNGGDILVDVNDGTSGLLTLAATFGRDESLTMVGPINAGGLVTGPGLAAVQSGNAGAQFESTGAGGGKFWLSQMQTDGNLYFIYFDGSAFHNWLIEDVSGNATVSGNVISSGGNLVVDGEGNGVQVKEGANCKQGVATLVAGTVTVSNTGVTANSRIFVTGGALNATTAVGEISVVSQTASTGFVITSYIPGGTLVQTGDLRTVTYEVFEPAP